MAKSNEQIIRELKEVDDIRERVLKVLDYSTKKVIGCSELDDLAEFIWNEGNKRGAAEREACCRDVCSLCAGVNPSYGPAIYTSPSSDLPPSWQHPNIETGNPWDAVPCLAAAIRARGNDDLDDLIEEISTSDDYAEFLEEATDGPTED